MAVKSVIEIDIDGSGNFAKFQASFDRYQKALKDSPKEWAKVTDGIGRSRKEFDNLVKQQVASHARTKLIADAEKEALRITTTMGDRWREMARNTRSTAANIKDATVSLLKWTSLTGVVSGLLGVGGLFGINRLAADVGGGRRSSLGLGLSYGQQKSFSTNFGRLVDPGSFLGAVADARGDVTKRVGFYGAGLSEGQLQGSTASIGVDLLRSLKKIADQTDPKLYAQVIQSRQLGQFVTTEDLRRLAATSGSEFEQLVGGYRKNLGTVDLSERTQKAWQDLSTQMTRAGNQIENTFVKGLLPLVPGLERLSEGVEKTIRVFLGSDTVKKWMDQLGEGLEKFAGYVGTPEFERNVATFARGLGKIASAFGTFFGWVAGTDPEVAAARSSTSENVSGMRKARQEGKTSSWQQFQDIFNGTAPSEVESYIRTAAKKRGINPDVAVNVAKSEGLYSYVGDKGTSFGPYQLHYKNNIPGLSNGGLGDEFTKATGLHAKDRDTVKQQIDFALDAAIRQGWTPWHGYKGGPRDGLPSPGSVVRIENNTGGNAIVTTNQLQGQN